MKGKYEIKFDSTEGNFEFYIPCEAVDKYEGELTNRALTYLCLELNREPQMINNLVVA